MSATEVMAARLSAMPDDLATAMVALRSKRVNCAFKAIEIARDAIHHNFHGLVIIVSANFAFHNMF
jgi:hypothetical protein